MFNSDPAISGQKWIDKSPASPKFSLKRLMVPLVGLLGSALIIFGLLPGLAYIFEPKSAVQNVFVSNVSDRQATISWTTDKPTKGAVKIGPTTYKDDGDKNLSRQGFYTTHHVTLTNLKPQQIYKYEIAQGRHTVHTGEVITGKTLQSLLSPNPVYGKAMGQDSKPLVGAIVYFRVTDPNSKSSLLSTLTNLEGGWSVDLANLRTSGLEAVYPVGSLSTEEVVIEGGSRGRAKATTTVSKDSPWPDIQLTQR